MYLKNIICIKKMILFNIIFYSEMNVKIYYLRDIKTNINLYVSLQFDELYKIKLDMIDNYYYGIYDYVENSNKDTFTILEDIFELFNSDNNPLANPGLK